MTAQPSSGASEAVASQSGQGIGAGIEPIATGIPSRTMSRSSATTSAVRTHDPSMRAMLAQAVEIRGVVCRYAVGRVDAYRSGSLRKRSWQSDEQK
jgi:hypothetical protein